MHYLQLVIYLILKQERGMSDDLPFGGSPYIPDSKEALGVLA